MGLLGRLAGAGDTSQRQEPNRKRLTVEEEKPRRRQPDRFRRDATFAINVQITIIQDAGNTESGEQESPALAFNSCFQPPIAC